MVVKIRRGSDMAGLLHYLVRDKEGVVRESPHVVTGLGRDGQALDAGSIRELADELDAPRVLSGTKVPAGHVWHCALSADPHDGVLTEEQRQSIARDFMRRTGFGEGVRWIAVHHGPNSAGADHLHLVVQCVREDGSAVDTWDDFKRASRARHEVAAEHGLRALPSHEAGLDDVPRDLANG